MLENLSNKLQLFYTENVISYLSSLYASPLKIIWLIVDIAIVIFLAVKFLQIMKNTRAWQLLKGIAFLIVVDILSGILGLKVLNLILTSFMTYGVIILIVVFQPELRRALEQLGTRNLNKYFGFDKDIAARTKENIYKIVLATMELAKDKIGALIVIERDIKIEDIIDTGIVLNADVSPQVIVNIFSPNTPLHDGAVVIRENKVSAAACMLPLAGDNDIAKELGTRHRAAIGISKESDAIAIVVSEETGKVSIAKDGRLIADLKEEQLKRILIKHIVTNQYETRKERLRGKFSKKEKSAAEVAETTETEQNENK